MSSPSRNACFSTGNVGDLGEQPQLDLRIVRRHQLVAGRGDEGAADLAAVLGAHRNVLQVRLVRRQPPGGGRGQRVGRVHAMGLRMDVFRQRVGIGRFQFRDLPPFQNLLREFVALFGEFVEDLRRGRPCAGLGLGAAGNAHLAEQDVADLLGAADIDRLAGDSCSSASTRAAVWAKSPDSRDSTWRSIEMPRRSIRASTETSGRSSVS